MTEIVRTQSIDSVNTALNSSGPIDLKAEVLVTLRQLMDDAGNKHKGIDRTTLWQFLTERNAGDPVVLFFSEPPVQKASIENRILVVSTRAEIPQVRVQIEKSAELIQSCTQVNYCTTTDAFWGQFFGKDNFLDALEGVTIPKGILTSGRIRNYSSLGGETMEVYPRLCEIGATWNIPVLKLSETDSLIELQQQCL